MGGGWRQRQGGEGLGFGVHRGLILEAEVRLSFKDQTKRLEAATENIICLLGTKSSMSTPAIL